MESDHDVKEFDVISVYFKARVTVARVAIGSIGRVVAIYSLSR